MRQAGAGRRPANAPIRPREGGPRDAAALTKATTACWPWPSRPPRARRRPASSCSPKARWTGTPSARPPATSASSSPPPPTATARPSATPAWSPWRSSPTDAAITERITLALIEAVANDHLRAGARVVVVYSGFEAETLDSITVVRLGEHLERLTARDLRALETSVPFETLKAVVDVAVEIGREGREGKAVGTLIVVGDVRNVLARSRTLGFDPFKGYRRKERNLRDVPRPRGDQGDRPDRRRLRRRPRRHRRGRLPDHRRPDHRPDPPQGPRHPPLGRRRDHQRHDALAVVVSQSTGTVRLFQKGEVILRIAPMRHARAMKWDDAETEPPSA